MRARFLLVLVLCVPVFGEQGRPGRGPVQKPLLACGQHGDIQVICGADRPEDIELAPDEETVHLLAALLQEQVYEEIGAFRARQLADIEGQGHGATS